MYKKIILSVFLILCLAGCSTAVKNDNHVKTEEEYVQAVWIAYYELSELTQNNNEQEFKKEIGQVFKDLKSKGFNRVTVQVRPFADAFYKSSYFPVSAYAFGEQGGALIYDPLEIMVDIAHKNKLSIEAWINPYRVSNAIEFEDLCSDNFAWKLKDTEDLIVCDSGIYYNPASEKAKDLIVNGVREIAKNYEVDSICFDDYFYPAKDKSIDKNFYKAYKEEGGKSALDDWRRENVSNMVSSVYKAVKEINPNITFGISPASNMDNDYKSLYADVERWATNEGYVDYICPQIYFGFQNESQPFMATTKAWAQMTDCTLYIALPLYKSGLEDEFAGDNGKNEFIENNNIVARQVIYLSKLDKIQGFYIFSYSSLKDNDETNNLYSAMQ
ncbi:MAG: family 10 glycosylhydrolase [Clostridium sp.]|nr:family 10 glycosylhydrolase [Clostridium sp.]